MSETRKSVGSKWRNSPIGCTCGSFHLIAPFRGAGIGTRLIEDLLQRAAARKKPVTLDVIHGNPARSLYLRLGFKQYGQDADKIQMIRRPTRG